MIYKFKPKEKELLSELDIPFDPFGNLTEDQELKLLDIINGEMLEEMLPDGVTPRGDLCGDILDSMAKQAD